MDMFAQGRLVHVIAHIQLGAAPVGPKHFEGDQRTPEGLYSIDWSNPDSRYYLSLHISYPDSADAAYAAATGRSAGGMIMRTEEHTSELQSLMRNTYALFCLITKT